MLKNCLIVTKVILEPNTIASKMINPQFILYFILLTSLFGMSQNKHIDEIKIGDRIPEFVLRDQNGNSFDIQSAVGKKNLVIYFYPKDDSPGCTAQACSFRDQFEAFNEADAMVIGISGQSVESHKEFAIKHRLNFTLLSDEGNKIRKQFGVPTNLFGLLPGRVTYIVDKTGNVIYVFNSQIQAKKHIDEALKILNAIK
jgi:peroxiredoxin Q/BCP